MEPRRSLGGFACELDGGPILRRAFDDRGLALATVLFDRSGWYNHNPNRNVGGRVNRAGSVIVARMGARDARGAGQEKQSSEQGAKKNSELGPDSHLFRDVLSDRISLKIGATQRGVKLMSRR